MNSSGNGRGLDAEHAGPPQSAREYRVADYVAEFLNAQGVRQVYEVVGGMITLMVDAIHLQGGARLVSMHHEQAAAFAADAAGRLTGIPGVAMATSGPGATNLLTGIGSAYFDSSPTVFITGQVNRNELRGERPIRQLGFQETDIVSVAQSLTKAAWLIDDPELVPARLREAFTLATSGRPGPVLLDIPMDVQKSKLTAPPPRPLEATLGDAPDWAAIDKALAALRRAERPLVLVGGGIRAGQATALFREFVERVNVPVVNSLLAVDVLPHGHPLRVGMIGSYGNRWANLAIGQADFLLVLGSRLDIRQTGADTDGFKGERTIFHVDCEAGEMNHRVLGCETIVSELRPFLARAVERLDGARWPARATWLAALAESARGWPDTGELPGVPGINPNQLMHDLAAVSRAASAYVVDVGQHQMWAAQSLDLGPDQRFLTSGGMGAMGFSLPAAIGAALAAPNRPVVLIAGDGSFQLNIQELQTVFRNRLPIKMVILDNGCHGMVRQFQESYFDGRYQSTFWGYSAPDFARVAEAYGIAGRRVEREEELAAALDWLWLDPLAPALLRVPIDTYANAYPKIAFGHPITQMEPFVQPIAMEST